MTKGRRAWAPQEATTTPEVPWRFDKGTHTYWLGDDEVPSITQMLDNCCYIDDRYYTEECADRGTWVHSQCAAYDLGGLERPATLELKEWTKDWKNYVLAYVKAMGDLNRPSWDAIERALVSTTHRFGGRPDRVGKLWNAVTVLDIKTGADASWHGIQTALQAILIAEHYKLPPTSIVRYGLYVRATGKYSLVAHERVRDFDDAFEVIRRCTRQRA